MAGAAVAAVAGGPFLSSVWSAAAGPNFPTRAGFADQLDSTFRVRRSDGNVDLVLAELTDLPAHANNAPGLSGEAFSLIFRGPASPRLASGLYTVVHASLGTFALTLGPVDRSPSQPNYEAVINRRAPQTQGSSHV
jgi:hypothetical protein